MNDGLPEGVVASSIETDQVNLGHKDRKFVLVPAVHPFRRLLASANPFDQWPIIVSSPGQKIMSFDEIVEEVPKLTGEERDALRSYLDQYEAMENDAIDEGRSFCGRGSDTKVAVREQQKARQAFLGSE